MLVPLCHPRSLSGCLLTAASALFCAAACPAGETLPSSADRGYEVLRTRPFLPADFDQEVFENLWKVWPEPLRAQAEQASPAERRKMAFSRYGLMEPPDASPARTPLTGESESSCAEPALGYVHDGNGGWVMNCLACHAGKVAGRVIPGLPNSHIALQTLTEDVIATKVAQGKKFSHLDKASLTLPLSMSNGTTNSVIFGVVLGAMRLPDMSVDTSRTIPDLTHHDVDAPPLWNVRKKSMLYFDGHVAKTHRPLMQFMLLPSNDADTVKGWERDFADILAWIESLTPPRYPWAIDQSLAARGKTVFEANCSRCHGTYGPGGIYQQQTIPIKEVATDPLRLKALTAEHRGWMQKSWMTHYGEDSVVLEPEGYVAPPLDGIWATAPYLHNGSVPTLWHLLHPDQRPAVWRRSENGYDRSRVGLEAGSLDSIPDSAQSPSERREYFNTRLPGKSATGHDFPAPLSEEEKRALLEYLKTL